MLLRYRADTQTDPNPEMSLIDESSAVVSVQLDTLIKAARALGKVIEIKIKRAPKKEAA